MGSGHRMAVVAAAAHVRHNRTQTVPVAEDPPQYNVNALFVSATLCGVLVAVCAACWRRAAPAHKPLHFHIESRAHAPSGVYTVSTDDRLAQQIHEDVMTGPPPAYDSVVILDPGPHPPLIPKDIGLHEVVSHPRDLNMERQMVPCVPLCDNNGLPSYEAAVLLRDTKL